MRVDESARESTTFGGKTRAFQPSLPLINFHPRSTVKTVIKIGFVSTKIYYISSSNEQILHIPRLVGLNILPSDDMSSDAFAFVATSL